MEIKKQTRFFVLFNLSENFTKQELKEAYRDLSHVWHPDKHRHNERLRIKAEAQLKEINEGYEFLKQNLLKRNEDILYDSELNFNNSADPNVRSDNYNKNKTNQQADRIYENCNKNNFGCLIVAIIVGLFFYFAISTIKDKNKFYSTYWEKTRKIVDKWERLTKKQFKIPRFLLLPL